MAGGSTSASVSMKEYLKRYQSGNEDPTKKKKKKKKVEKPKSSAMGVLVVDEDPVWQKPVQIEQESDSDDEEGPQVEEDIEVRRMKRLEAIRAKKPYNAISEDGSGWVPVLDNPLEKPSEMEKPDLSPPRQRKGRLDTPPEGNARRARRDSPEDISPPRRKARHDSEEPLDISPPRRSRKNNDGGITSDLSPPRRMRRDSGEATDLSPPRRKSQVDSTANLSPPRRRARPDLEAADMSPPRRRARHDSVETAELSPPRRKKHQNLAKPADLSPPRRRTRHDSAEPADLSPPRRRTRHDSAEPADMSPPRRRTRHDSAEPADLSPPRRKNEMPPPRRKSQFDSIQTSNLSPPRHRVRHDSVESAERSPPRRKTGLHSSEDADLSPPRKSRKRESEGREREEDLSPPRKSKKGPSDDLSPPRKAPPGPQTKMGLLSSEEIREQNKKMKEQESRILSSEAFIGSKDAEAVFRKDGKRISREDMAKPEKKEKPKEKPLEWGKGLAQKREAEAKVLELEKEKNKPFARSRDDPELDKMLKETVRWGDPMAHLVKKKYSEPALEDLGDDEKMKESGFIIPQTIPNHSWLKRGLDFPPNRYGIRPGRHWDGVDRSTGFEKEMFKRQNERRATDREAYLWSVSDM